MNANKFERYFNESCMVFIIVVIVNEVMFYGLNKDIIFYGFFCLFLLGRLFYIQWNK